MSRERLNLSIVFEDPHPPRSPNSGGMEAFKIAPSSPRHCAFTPVCANHSSPEATPKPFFLQVLYSITKHAMRRSADEIGATSISFRPKVFSDPASVIDCAGFLAGGLLVLLAARLPTDKHTAL